MAQGWNRRLYDLLESRHPRGLARIVQWSLLVLILLNVVAVVLETVPDYERRYGAYFFWFEAVSVAVFTLEYAARLYCCVSGPDQRFRHPLRGRLRHALTPMALLDLVAILPLYLFLLFGVDLGSLRVVRLLRILKLLRYSPSTEMLGRILYNERKSLGGAMIFLAVLLLFAGTAAHYVEREAQPKLFGSIPDAMWWAMAALTTVGYGDVTPITPLGRIIAGFVTLLGIGVIALPTGIVASAFVEESKRREFVVTWTLVAEVPFFRGFTAPRLAELARCLYPQFARTGDEIVRKGDPGDAMFIIMAGEVEVELGAGRTPILLEKGAFFGEMALIDRAPRTATVRAAAECKLLRLNADDFDDIMQAHPELRAEILRVAAERRAALAARSAASGA